SPNISEERQTAARATRLRREVDGDEIMGMLRTFETRRPRGSASATRERRSGRGWIRGEPYPALDDIETGWITISETTIADDCHDHPGRRVGSGLRRHRRFPELYP